MNENTENTPRFVGTIEQEHTLSKNTSTRPLRGLRTSSVMSLSLHTGQYEYDTYCPSLDEKVQKAIAELEREGYAVVDVKFTVTEDDSSTSYYAMLMAVPDSGTDGEEEVTDAPQS